jgi:hypothetical protein
VLVYNVNKELPSERPTGLLSERLPVVANNSKARPVAVPTFQPGAISIGEERGKVAPREAFFVRDIWMKHVSVLFTCLAHFICTYAWGKRVRIKVRGVGIWPNIRIVRVGNDAIKEEHSADSAGVCLCEESCDGASNRVANEDKTWVMGRIADLETFSPDLKSKLLEVADCRHYIMAVAIRRLLVIRVTVRFALAVAVVALIMSAAL